MCEVSSLSTADQSDSVLLIWATCESVANILTITLTFCSGEKIYFKSLIKKRNKI